MSRQRKGISYKTKDLVWQRAGSLCEYCLATSTFSFHSFCIDHIIPVSKGGTNDEGNLALSCQHCNNCKYQKVLGKDPLTRLEVSLFNPRLSKWVEHFIWSEDLTRIIGITPTGRAAVTTLKMNRNQAVNLRKALYSFGIHPPK